MIPECTSVQVEAWVRSLQYEILQWSAGYTKFFKTSKEWGKDRTNQGKKSKWCVQMWSHVVLVSFLVKSL